MDLEALKGKTLDDDTHGKLVAFVAELAGQRDAARKESIDGRKGKDAKLKELGDRLQAFAERLGVEVDADLDKLPDAKGQADAVKQYEAKLARVARERDDAIKARDELGGALKTRNRESAIASSLEGHRFRNPSDVRVLIERHVQEEGDDLLFKTEDGKLVPLKEGVAWFAKTRPDYLLPEDAGGQGSGYRGSGNGPNGSGNSKKGDLSGDREARVSAIAARFPELAGQRG